MSEISFSNYFSLASRESQTERLKIWSLLKNKKRNTLAFWSVHFVFMILFYVTKNWLICYKTNKIANPLLRCEFNWNNYRTFHLGSSPIDIISFAFLCRRKCFSRTFRRKAILSFSVDWRQIRKVFWLVTSHEQTNTSKTSVTL